MELKLASRFERFLASVVDCIILRAIEYGIIILLAKLSSFQITPKLIFIIDSMLYVLYFSGLESSRYQATLGKKLFKLYVATTTGKQLSFFRALLRYVIFIIPAVPLLIINSYFERYSSLLIPQGALYFVSLALAKLSVASEKVLLISSILYLIWFIPILFKGRKGIHDSLSSSMVYTKTLDIKLASRFKRALASIIDNIILLIFLVPFIGIWYVLRNIPFVLPVCVISYLLLVFLYHPILESSKHQASFGKRLFNLYVATTDDKRISFLRSFSRLLISLIPVVIGALAESAFEYPKTDKLYETGRFIGAVISLSIYMLFFLPILLPRRRGVHEILTSTIVYRRIKSS